MTVEGFVAVLRHERFKLREVDEHADGFAAVAGGEGVAAALVEVAPYLPVSAVACGARNAERVARAVGNEREGTHSELVARAINGGIACHAVACCNSRGVGRCFARLLAAAVAPRAQRQDETRQQDEHDD